MVRRQKVTVIGNAAAPSFPTSRKLRDGSKRSPALSPRDGASFVRVLPSPFLPVMYISPPSTNMLLLSSCVASATWTSHLRHASS
eukprot:1770060-Pyramimonas_sp.AAC.1